MAIYRQIDPRLHDDEKFVQLTDSQQMLWVALITGPQTTIVPGLMIGGVATLAEIRRRPVSRVKADMDALERLGMVEVDPEKRVIRLPNGPKFAELRNQKQLLGWFRAWQGLPESQLKYRHIESLRRHLWSDQSWFGPTWERTFGAVTSGTVPDTVSDTVTGTVSNTEQNRTEQSPPTPRAGGARGSAAPTPPNAPAPRSDPTAPPDPIDDLLGHWRHARQDRHGIGPETDTSRHRDVFRELLSRCCGDVRRAKAAIEAFVADRDDWIAERGWAIHAFSARIDAAVAAASKRRPPSATPKPADEPPPVDPNDPEIVAARERAMAAARRTEKAVAS